MRCGLFCFNEILCLQISSALPYIVHVVLSYFELLSKAVFVSQALELQLAALQVEVEQLRQKETLEELTRSGTQIQELQAQ